MRNLPSLLLQAGEDCTLNAAIVDAMGGNDEISNETLAKETEKAVKRIEQYVRKTPLEKSVYLSKKTGANVYLKMGELQHLSPIQVG